MKKLLALPLAVCMLAPVAGFATANSAPVSAKAAGSAASTGDWMPHNYMLSGYEIPTSMSYDGAAGTVSFSGSLNAGIATTGFSYNKAIDVTDFSVDMTLNIPDVDKLEWLCVTLLDKNIFADEQNPIPVNMPFNAASGLGAYKNTEQTGLVVMFRTNKLLSENVLGLGVNAKNLDVDTGEETGEGFADVTPNRFISDFKLDEIMDAQTNGNFSFSLTANTDGVGMNVNDGAWKGKGDGGEYDYVTTYLNSGNTLAGFKEYFSEHDCYFGMVMMYSDGNHRPVTLTVNEVNGMKASDGVAPAYLADKTVAQENVSVTVPNSAVGNFGVYASSIDGLKVKKYDETDGDWDIVKARADKLGYSVVDYFSIYPTVDGVTVNLKGAMEVEYTLPSGYSDFKVYFLNEDGEAQEMGTTLAAVSNGKAVIKIDNDEITQVIVYGKESAKEKKSGCNSSVYAVSASIMGVVALAAVACVVVFGKKSERGE